MVTLLLLPVPTPKMASELAMAWFLMPLEVWFGPTPTSTEPDAAPQPNGPEFMR